ncbi:MAG: sulfurtransferase TusA family protein [Gallionellaceae bacterium]
MHMVNITLDMKGLSCPAPLIGAKRMVDDLAPGQVMLLISDCPATPDDLFVWAKHTGNQIVKTEKMPSGGTGYHIQKGRAPSHAHVTLDIRGAVCPGPIVEAKKLLGGMQTGEVLRLISDCVGVQNDINGWADATGMTILESFETSQGVFEFYIRKG